MDIQVRCNLKPVSGLPEDWVVNTFAVSVDTVGTGENIFNAFDGFYNEVPAGGSLCIANYLAWTIERTNGLLIELIEDPGTPPNVPFASDVRDLEPASSTGDPEDPVDPLPQEVALCSSFFAAGYPDETVTPGRLRGRVYIGPLSYNTNGGVAAGQPARPGSPFVYDVVSATHGLQTYLDAFDITLSIWSRVDDIFRPVVGGWVDNEWDTQRRRGRVRDSRSFWP